MLYNEEDDEIALTLQGTKLQRDLRYKNREMSISPLQLNSLKAKMRVVVAHFACKCKLVPLVCLCECSDCVLSPIQVFL